MPQILIIKTPRGEAPEHIRRAWLGLALPCIGISYSSVGVLSEKPTNNGEGYSVPQKEAIRVLAGKKPKAAAWWTKHGFPKPGKTFVFYKDEVLVLEKEENKNQNAWG